jgi:glycosyltransferase 2 family protein
MPAPAGQRPTEPSLEELPSLPLRSKWWRLMFAASLTALFLWLVLREIRIDSVGHALSAASPLWLLAAIVVFALGYACRIERWRLMLLHHRPQLQWRACVGPFLASFAANNLLPLRAGDVLRAFAFNRNLETSSGIVLGTLLVERLLDLLMVLVLLVAALAIFDLRASRYVGISTLGLICLATALVLLLVTPRLWEPVLIAMSNVVTHIVPQLGARVRAEAGGFVLTLGQLARGHAMLKLTAWSGLAWGLEGLVYWFTALALPDVAWPVAGGLALPLTAVATLIPSAPGYWGTFDFFAVRAMTALGNSTTSATAYALLVHLVIWLPVTLSGGLYWLCRPRKSH